MDQLRRIEKNNILNDIKQFTNYIKVDVAAIHRLKQSDSNKEFNAATIVEITQKNIDRKEKIKNLEDRLNDLNIGNLDEELKKSAEETLNEIQQKTDLTRQRKLDAKKDKEKDKEKSIIYYNKTKLANRETRWGIKNEQRETDKFFGICDTIPSYMTKKLKTMPNNKGYIWKKIWLFGELDAEIGQPTMMIERRYDILYIHECYKNEIRIYKKIGNKGKKTLESITPRRPIKLTSSHYI